MEQRSDKTPLADRMQLFYDDWEHNSKIRASFSHAQSYVEENFVALQISTNTLAIRLDKLDATKLRHGHASQQLMKSMNESLSQRTAAMTQMPAKMKAAMTASMSYLKTLLDGVNADARSSSSGQKLQTQAQQQPPQKWIPRFPPKKPFGHVIQLIYLPGELEVSFMRK